MKKSNLWELPSAVPAGLNMKSRREFFKTAAAAGVLGSLTLPLAAMEPTGASPVYQPGDDRHYWVTVLDKIATPVLENLARRELRRRMPVEAQPGAQRAPFTHLEAFARLLCGLAPWLGATGLAQAETALQQKHLAWTQTALDAATDPSSPDFLNFSQGGQALVDTAFLAQALLRAPQVLWEPLEPRVRQQLIAALQSSRKVATPANNNWVMFAATVEAALLHFGEPTIAERLENCLRKMLGWYQGDGAYGDALRGGAGTAHCPGWRLSRARPLPVLPLRGFPIALPNRLAAGIAAGNPTRASPVRPDGGDPPAGGRPRNL
jgi:hypothetical protein